MADNSGMRIIAVSVVVLASGCLGGKSYMAMGSVYDLRWDKNTWNQFALTVERRDHKPSETQHVRHFRWLHGESPVLPHPGEVCAKLPKPAKHHRRH